MRMMMGWIAAALLAAPAGAQQQGLTTEALACAKAAGLSGAGVTAPIRFRNGAESFMMVSGLLADGPRKGKPAARACLYDHRTGKAEAKDASPWTRPGK